MIKYIKCECGAALVEYGVALIIVTIIGGAGAVSIANNTGVIAMTAENSTNTACTTVGAKVNLEGTC